MFSCFSAIGMFEIILFSKADLDLPRIAVIGSQSVGKSSLVEVPVSAYIS